MNTRKNYELHLSRFLDFSGRNAKMDPADRVRWFLNTYRERPAALKIAYSAVQFFYKHVPGKECPYKLTKVKKVRRIPVVFTKSEIHQILNTIKNKKHRTMIAMLYGSGLRVSEVVNLRFCDLFFEKKKLRVSQGKGKKDRITLLSARCIPVLKELGKNKKASDYIFPTITTKKYSIRTVQLIFTRALEKSGIPRTAGCHSLRHSFATHLVESGIGINRVRELLGHKSVKTTMTYLHVANILNQEISSPL